MDRKPQKHQSRDLFRFPLAEHLNPNRELVPQGDEVD